jgi:hypothetical protein
MEAFFVSARGDTARNAFSRLQKRNADMASYADFTLAWVPHGTSPREFASALVSRRDSRLIPHKVAGCVSISDDEWLFFGWRAWA